MDTLPESAHPQLIINEAAVHGCAARNEFGERADLIELYNSGDAFELEAGTWFLSDAPADPMRYELPAHSMPAHGFLVVWCDAAADDAEEPHAGFKLSGGEHLALWHLEGNALHLVDSAVLLPQARKRLTQGRPSNDHAHWTWLSEPTPGTSNKAAAVR